MDKEELSAAAGKNRLLARLPASSLQEMLQHMELREVETRFVFFLHNQPISHVGFVVTGVVSMISHESEGGTVEVATIGNEGFAGLPVFLGARASTLDAFVQVPGRILLMSTEHFLRYAADDRDLRAGLNLYIQALITQIAQASACNRLHQVRERCARWLLLTHDRMDGDQFPLTHEFLAQMLGVRRASVSTTAGELQQAGLIEYERGIMTIKDRKGLEDASCECYGIIAREYERLLGGP